MKNTYIFNLDYFDDFLTSIDHFEEICNSPISTPLSISINTLHKSSPNHTLHSRLQKKDEEYHTSSRTKRTVRSPPRTRTWTSSYGTSRKTWTPCCRRVGRSTLCYSAGPPVLTGRIDWCFSGVSVFKVKFFEVFKILMF